MYLKRLEIQGFKSLADKIELQFNPGVSAIVGPNGSGKSNISDAVRWVLGEQSAKSLRGAKMEDIIFAGSDKRKAVGMAEVSMTLDNSTAVFPLDYAEITVTRRVYRSGESEYLINKTPCRLKDIHEMFMDTGIGREGYSIIGQGKIEEILNARSEDRRVIIEEAAGIVKYKNRKGQAVKKLHDTEQNMVRISDIINELEAQVEPLAEQSATASKYLNYKQELDELEVNLLVNQCEDQKQKLNEINSRDDNLKSRQIELETAVRNMESAIETQKLAVNRLDEEINTVQTNIYNTGNSIEKCESEIRVGRERINGLNTQKENLGQEIAEMEDKAAREKGQHSGDEAALAGVRGNLASCRSELEVVECRLQQVETGFLERQRLIEEEKGDIIELLNEMAGVKNIIGSGETEIQGLMRRQAQLAEQRNALEEEISEVQERENKLAKQVESTDADITDLKAQTADLAGTKETLAADITGLKQELNITRTELQEKGSKLKALSELQRDYEGYHRGVKEVLLAGQKGKVTGITGVVAELIKVSRKYETAVEVALGGALQHIVTETDEQARKAIEFLKSSGAGRATFLPLNTIKPVRETDTKLKGKPGFLGMACDLVEYDPKHVKAVEYVLGRVAVVENIRYAVEIARSVNHSIRLVTLDGDVMSPGGSMTGGVYKKGSANLLGRIRDIEETEALMRELEQKTAKLDTACLKVQQQYDECENRINTVAGQLQDLYMKKNSLDKDITVVSQDKQRIANTLSVIIQESEVLEGDIKNIRDRIDSKRGFLQELETKDRELRVMISRHQEELSGSDSERSRLGEEATAQKVVLAGLLQEELNYTQVLQKAAESIKEIQVQIKRKFDQTADIERQLAGLAGEIEVHSGNITVLGQEKGELEELVNKLRNDKQSLASEIADNETGVKKVTREMTQITDQIHSSEVRKARLEMEIENLAAKLTEEFQLTYEEALLRKTEIRNRRETTVRIKELREAIGALGNVNIGAIEEYERVRERYEFLQTQYNDLEQAKDSLYRVIAEMDQIMTKRFGEAFREINIRFGEVFNRFFGGGRAELLLTDSENLLESGIDIVAQPPGKKPQHLSLLSGGEKALTAISLLFAILKTKPSPFCILDEIEAALDEANVDRFATYLTEFALGTQFIVITHRKRTMESADILYGVTMDASSVTKMVSMKLSDNADKVS